MMSKYTINNGKFIGKFEELYKKFDNPFLQTEMEKYETTKKIILNYVNELKDKNKKKLKTLEIGCGFGKLTNDLKNIGVNSYGIDISETAIKKAKKKYKCKFYVADILNEKLFLEIKPDIIIMPEVTWYILPNLKKFIKFLKKNFKGKYLIHTLAIYYPGKQKYGKNFFTTSKGIMKYFDLDYLEFGEKWTKKEGRSFFIAKI